MRKLRPRERPGSLSFSWELVMSQARAPSTRLKPSPPLPVGVSQRQEIRSRWENVGAQLRRRDPTGARRGEEGPGA